MTVTLPSAQALVLQALHRLTTSISVYLPAEDVAAEANLSLATCESALASLDFKGLVVGWPTKSGGMAWCLQRSAADEVLEFARFRVRPGPRSRLSALALHTL